LRYAIDVPHYAISIIRGVGIDRTAMDYLLARHSASSILFVDGWTGKGAIARQLAEAMRDYPEVSPGLAVLSDPANVAMLSGTQEDFLIASSCLNCTVSGLMSRTFNRSDIILPGDFHGAAYYGELKDADRTYEFIDAVAAHFSASGRTAQEEESLGSRTGLMEAQEIAAHFGIRDINLVKPSIGEATRVLLRRVPNRILVRSLDDAAHIGHILQLAQEKHVPVEEYPLRNYRACGLIQAMGDI